MLTNSSVGFTPLTDPIVPKGIYFNECENPSVLQNTNSESDESRIGQIAISTFADYEKEMHRLKLPLILVVGCGHFGHHHSHPNSWCVNLDIDPDFFFNNPKDKSSEMFKEKMQHDAVLDIASIISNPSHPSEKPISLRDDLSKASPSVKIILEYKNKFDVVLLERPYPKTLNKAWTLWNAVHMLKVNGELIIDSCEGYNSELYENKFNSVETLRKATEAKDNRSIIRIRKMDFYVAACCTDTLENGNYKESVKTENYLEKIKRFEISEKMSRENEEMAPMANYLARWFLSDIINTKDAYQPYAERKKTELISATKTQLTEDSMEQWAQAIKSFNFIVNNK